MSLPKQVGPRRTIEKGKRMNASDYVVYLEKGLEEAMEIYYEGTDRDWNEGFKMIAKAHGKLTNNVAIEYVESWNPEESNRMGYEYLHQVSIKNAKAAFPGHSLVVVPQVNENGNFHTHVLICAVSDDGQRVRSTFTDRKRWKSICDKESRQIGLSTVSNKGSKQKERLSKNSRQALKRRASPKQLQIMQRADFARRIATDMEGYVKAMLLMGVRVEDKGKVLNYFHSDSKDAIRDRRFGLNYGKEELNNQFRRNKDEFSKRPSLQQLWGSSIGSIFDERGNIVGDTSKFPFLPGGHQKFSSNGKDGIGEKTPGNRNIANDRNGNNSLLYVLSDEINSAKNRSIVDYCKSNSIGLRENKDGTHSLSGKEHILIKGNKWENTKTNRYGKKVGTSGSLIEFVANHKDVTILESLSAITDNGKLLLLQNYLGREKRSYKEFHIPREKRAKENEALKTLKKLTKALGFKSELGMFMRNIKNIQVGVGNIVRFSDGDHGKGFTDYKLGKDGVWKKKSHGVSWSGLISQKGSSKSAKVFKSPFTFIDLTKGKGVMAYKSSDNLLVLSDESNTEALDFFVAKNPKIKLIDLFGFDSKDISKSKIQDFKSKGIEFNFITSEGINKSKNIGIDIDL